MKSILLLFTMLFCLKSYAQDSIVIKGQFKHNSKFAKVVVSKFGVGSFSIAAAAIKNENLNIAAPSDIEPGVYRFQYSQTANDYLDIILNGKEKEISFSIDLLSENKTPHFSKSLENINWYSYQNQSQIQLQKIEILNQFLALYPSGNDKIVAQAKQALVLEKENYTNQKNFFLKNNPNTWAALMVQNKNYYFTNPKDDWRIQNLEKHEHFWDQINTINPELIKTPIYTELILDYLKYYMNPEMGLSEVDMTNGLKASVDTIMSKFEGNEVTKKFALKYLQLGFKEIGKEEVLQYIDQKYQALAAQCQDNKEKTDFEKRLAAYAAMKSGNLAPNIVFENNSSLYEIISEQTMLVFWASWCPHCMQEMPTVNEWAKEHPNTKVVAISLDDTKTEYEKAIKEFTNLNHHTDLKKWNGQAVKDYYVFGTPTFVLLDKNKKILKKASSFSGINF